VLKDGDELKQMNDGLNAIALATFVEHCAQLGYDRICDIPTNNCEVCVPVSLPCPFDSRVVLFRVRIDGNNYPNTPPLCFVDEQLPKKFVLSHFSKVITCTG
jgi:hypothetical protein